MLGGSFDPVHIGHLLMADEVLARLSYEQIRFIPAHTPPHKRGAPAASAEQRLEMLRLATADRAEFVVDSFELDQQGVSYTVNTLRYLTRSSEVTERPGLVIGEDLVAGFSRWRAAEEIEALADVILVRRPGGNPARFDRRHTLIDNLPLDVSSTEIRSRVGEGLPFRYLVPPGVYEYIRDHGLYRAESKVT